MPLRPQKIKGATNQRGIMHFDDQSVASASKMAQKLSDKKLYYSKELAENKGHHSIMEVINHLQAFKRAIGAVV